MTETQLAPVESRPLATVQGGGIDIGNVIEKALASGRPMAELKEAFDLYERMEAIQRLRAFNAAFAAFKRDCGPIIRRTKDEYITVSRDGRRVARMYASLHDIARVVDPPLHSNGLTYGFSDAEQTPDLCIIRRFILRHVGGHVQPPIASPPIPIEGGEAYKRIDPNRKATSASPQQRLGVADTYAMRYAMISGLGLTSCDHDDDAGSERIIEGATGPTLTEDQVHSMEDLIIDVGANRDLFLKHVKVKALSDIPACDYEHWMGQLERKRAK